MKDNKVNKEILEISYSIDYERKDLKFIIEYGNNYPINSGDLRAFYDSKEEVCQSDLKISECKKYLLLNPLSYFNYKKQTLKSLQSELESYTRLGDSVSMLELESYIEIAKMAFLKFEKRLGNDDTIKLLFEIEKE